MKWKSLKNIKEHCSISQWVIGLTGRWLWFHQEGEACCQHPANSAGLCTDSEEHHLCLKSRNNHYKWWGFFSLYHYYRVHFRPLTCSCPVLPVRISAGAGARAAAAGPEHRTQMPSPLCWEHASGCPGATGPPDDPSPVQRSRKEEEKTHGINNDPIHLRKQKRLVWSKVYTYIGHICSTLMGKYSCRGLLKPPGTLQ